MIDRRGFLAGVGALGWMSALPVWADAVNPGRRIMRLGAISDIHITDIKATEPLEAVLRIFDKAKVDGVICCGDLADYGVVPQLKLVADTWKKVFPKGRGGDGRPVVNLFHYGDHDTEGNTYRRCKPCVEMFPDEEEMKKIIIGRIDRKKVWEEAFDEEWTPIMHRQVKGFDFVLANHTCREEGNRWGNNIPGLEKYLDSLKLDTKKPFFYSQHRVYKNTACGPKVWGQEDGTTGAIFTAKYPNVIAFCGHNHHTAANDDCVWKGAFTAIEVPSLRYCTTLGGRENGFALDDWGKNAPDWTMPKMVVGEGYDLTRQGYIVDVYEDRMVIKRFEFKRGLPMGHDWVVPFKGEVERRGVPSFPADAKAEVKPVKAKTRGGIEKEMYELTFPTASGPRAYDYEVRVVKNGKIVARRSFFSKIIYAEKDDTKVVARMLKSDVPEGATFEIAARDSSEMEGGVIKV